MWAAGIFGNVPTDCAGLLAGWIRREIQSIFFDRARELKIHHARLYYGSLIRKIDFEDTVHPRKGDHQAAAPRERSAGEPGAGASAYNRYFIQVCQTYNFH